MKLLTIKPNVLQDLFSYLKNKRKFKIIKYNISLHKKLNISNDDYKELFFKNKLQTYNYFYIKTYWNQFQNDFKGIINKDSYNLFLNILSKIKNFNLKLNDEDFNSLINNSYFKKNVHIIIEDLDKLDLKFELDYMKEHLNDFKNNINMYNFLILINKIKDINLNKICLNKNIEQIFIEYLNKYGLFDNLKEIEISTSNLHLFVDLKIICPKVNKLSCFIDNNFKYNTKEIVNLFPNIIILNLLIQNTFGLNEFMNYLKDTKIQNLYIKCDEEDIKLNSKLILDNIKNLRIDIYQNNNLLIDIFNYIEFKNLESYEINSNFNQLIQNINIEQIGNNDYNSVNIFLIEILKNKEQFIFNKFINLPQKFQKLKYLKINLNTFAFIIQYKKYFGFYLNNKEDFKNYYLNYDLSIDEKEILKYKKLKIEGLNINDNKIEEIIEDENINICDINLNINLKKYYIKGYKEVKSIYCENEIEKTNFIELVKEIINKNGFKKIYKYNNRIYK